MATKPAATKTASTKAAAAKEAPAKAAKPSKAAPKGSAEHAAAKGQNTTSAFFKPLTPSKELAAVIGADALPRSEAVSKMWEYIKKHDLQNPKNKREILADAHLEKVFGKKAVSMFEMNKHLAAHLKG